MEPTEKGVSYTVRKCTDGSITGVWSLDTALASVMGTRGFVSRVMSSGEIPKVSPHFLVIYGRIQFGRKGFVSFCRGEGKSRYLCYDVEACHSHAYYPCPRTFSRRVNAKPSLTRSASPWQWTRHSARRQLSARSILLHSWKNTLAEASHYLLRHALSRRSERYAAVPLLLAVTPVVLTEPTFRWSSLGLNTWVPCC